MARWRWI